MFCPRCAAHNIDDAHYCRVCGADISILPQVLSGQFTEELASADETAVEEKVKRRKGKHKDKEKEKKTPTLEDAFSNIGVGIAFLIISIMVALYMPGGRIWWFWLLIPTGACAGEGIGQLIRARREKYLEAGGVPLFQPVSHEAQLKNLPPRNTSEILPPPSITEGTTRHLGPEPAARSHNETTERSKEHA